MNYVYQVENMPHAGPMTDGYVWRYDVLEIAARADAKIAELQQSITIRDTEIARLETDLELARRDAGRYRWLRKHFRFANDSMHEIWFDETLAPDGERELDAAIDAARAGNGGGV